MMIKLTTTIADFFIVYDDNDVLNIASHQTSWVIDSSASIHTTSQKYFIVNYISDDFGTVKIDGNGGLTEIFENEDMCLETNNSTILVLRDAKCIIDIHLNLIFTSKFDEELGNE